jgi:hypothetical protein
MKKATVQRKEKGICIEHQIGFYELLNEPRMKAIHSGLAWTFNGHYMEESYVQY